MQTHKHTYSFSKTDFYIWLTAFALLCINFLPLITHFIWGNHDWLPLIADNHLNHGFIEGRITQYLLQNIFLMGKILPIANIILGFIFYTFALIILFKYFYRIKTSVFYFVLVLSLTAILPYINEILYFHFISFSFLTWPIILCIALLLAKRASEKNFLYNTFLSSFFLFLAIAGYPACINFYVTAVSCLVMQKSVSTKFKHWIKSTFPFIISMGIAVLTLKICFLYLQKEHLMMPLYNNSVCSLWELFYKLPQTIGNSIFSFVRPQPFFPLSLKILTTTIIITFFIFYLSGAKNYKTFFIRLSLCIFTLICLKFSAWVVHINPDDIFTLEDNPFYMLRADFYAFPIFLAFCLFTLHNQSGKAIRNLTFIFLISLIYLCTCQNISFSKTHLLGFSAENKLLDRIISRIETHPSYKQENAYSLIQAGELPLRTKYYTYPYSFKTGYYTLNVPYFRHWVAFEFYNFYAPQKIVSGEPFINPQNIKPEMVDFLARYITPWPSKDALYIDDTYIILALTPQGKNLLTSQFNLLHGK